MAFGRLRVDELETSTQVVDIDSLAGASGTVTSVGLVAPTGFSVTGSPVTTSGNITLSFAPGYSLPTTAGQSNWDTAYSERLYWNGGATGLNAATGRASLGLGGSATLNVGTIAGTVAAGDDSRLTTDLGYTASTRVLSSSTGADVTLPLFTSTAAGLAPLSGGGTSNFLRADGTWAAPATGGTPGGTTGQLQWNSSDSFAGVGGSTVGATGDITLSLNGTASTPPFRLTGTWFTGGTTITTKPHFLIEPAGTTSTAWDTSGTGLGINAASGFTGNLLDLQVNGTSLASFRAGDAIGQLYLHGTGTTANVGTFFDSSRFYGWRAGVPLIASSFVGVCIATNTLPLFIGTTNTGTNRDTPLYRDAAGTLAQRNGTNAQTLRVYGTYTDLSNHVRGSLSATSTAVTLAAETAGTGADNIPLNLTAAGTGTVKINSVAEVAVSSTVAGLPTSPAIGMLTRVTDASSPTLGATVSGGGSAAALVWYNGANWTVLGV